MSALMAGIAVPLMLPVPTLLGALTAHATLDTEEMAPPVMVRGSCFYGNTTILSVHVTLDIDECTDGRHNCAPNATCTNTAGSFNCVCNTGYTGSGITCEGKRLLSAPPVGANNREEGVGGREGERAREG
jgi:hypothetical protein